MRINLGNDYNHFAGDPLGNNGGILGGATVSGSAIRAKEQQEKAQKAVHEQYMRSNLQDQYSTAPRRATKIPQLLEEQEKTAAILAEVISALEVRLASGGVVCERPFDEVAKAGTGSASTAACALGRSIANNTAAIHLAQFRIQALIDQLEI